MSGIALVIPNADFSGSPLGKVTFKKTVSEMINEYATKIGTEAYNTPLASMLYALEDLGVLEDIDVYPMLGDTLAKKKVNLLSKSNILETEWQGRDLVFGNNASAEEDYVYLNAASTTGEVSNHDVNVNTSDSPYIYSDVRISVATGQIYTNRESTNVLVGLNDGNARFVAGGRDNQSNVSIQNSRVRFGCSSYSDGLDIYVNETKYAQSGSASTSVLTFTDVIGPKGSNKVSAYMYFFAKGLIPQAKIGSLNTIFKDFLAEVKPVE